VASVRDLSPIPPSPSPGGLPLVTIGVPTYKRPHLLRRALECLVAQDYRNVEVIVADNDTPGDEVTQIVESFRARIPGLVFIKQPRNIGPFANFFSILEVAHGKYFMWLADDDEISDNYVSALTALLEANPDASSAAAHWINILEDGRKQLRSTASFAQKSSLARSLRFIWSTDDAFFYALHRSSTLRQATFPGYCWPNRGVLLNWGYVFLLDLVLRGRVLLAPDPSVKFLNYASVAPKLYLDHNRGGLIELFRFVIRRCNIHWLYLKKTTGVVGWWALPPATAVSLLALAREIGAYVIAMVRQKLKRPITAEQRQ
jgi:glycosyltransferase involved in cell wall biosynthesis